MFMGSCFRYILFSLILISCYSYSYIHDVPLTPPDSDGSYEVEGTHRAISVPNQFGDIYISIANGYLYVPADGRSSYHYINGYLAGEHGLIESRRWRVYPLSYARQHVYIDFEYIDAHSYEFMRCYPFRFNLNYEFSDTHDVLLDPSHPEYGTVPAVTYGGCTYVIMANDCPDYVLDSYSGRCTATDVILVTDKPYDKNKPVSRGDDSSVNDKSGSSGDSSFSSGDSSGYGSGSSSGGSGISSGVGVPVFTGGGSGSPSGDTGSGGGSGTSSGDTGSGDGSGTSSGDTGSGYGSGTSSVDTGSGDGSGTSSGGTGSGGGSGTSSGGTGSGGGSGSSSGGTGSGGGSGLSSGGSSGASFGAHNDDDGSNIFLPSLNIPELSLSPLWNIWPSARDFNLSLPSSHCPVFNIEVFGRNHKIDTFCTLLTENDLFLLRLIFILAGTVISFFIVLRS
ncbi:hypothetical protein AAE121_002316 [Salmonella enterica]